MVITHDGRVLCYCGTQVGHVTAERNFVVYCIKHHHGDKHRPAISIDDLMVAANEMAMEKLLGSQASSLSLDRA